MAKVFLAIPCYDNRVEAGTMMAVLSATRRFDVEVCTHATSILPHGFNVLWARAHENNNDFWCMLHADVCPDPGFLDALHDDWEESRADFISAAIPIKSLEGCYSTAMGYLNKPPHYRLQHQDLAQLPMVFDSCDVRLLGHTGLLCVNTGLSFCRLHQDWNEELYFQMRTWMEFDEEGRRRPQVIPEDWDLSYRLHQMALRVHCTQRIGLTHAGRWDWRFDTPKQVIDRHETQSV